MNKIRQINLILMIFIIGQLTMSKILICGDEEGSSDLYSSSSSMSANSSTQKTVIDPIQVTADRLTNEAYFSPEMQYFITAAIDAEFTINIATGKLYNIPSVQQIMTSNPTDLNIKINALHAAIEATQIALFVAGLETAYAQPEYLFTAPNLSSHVSRSVTSAIGLKSPDMLMPTLNSELIEKLNDQKKNLQDALNAIPEYNSWWSWIPTSLVNMVSINSNISPFDNLQMPVKPNNNNYNGDQNNVTLPENLMKQIIKNYDYKQKINIDETANLLFKQCFIAQQPLVNKIFVCSWQPNNSIINSAHYIYDYFPTIETLCIMISTNVSNSLHASIQLPTARTQAHVKLLQIRKAIQTALFIANKNSVFYLGYILPPAIMQYLDDITRQLMMHDTKLSKLCTDERLGATKADKQRDVIWTRITWIAAGLALGSAIDYGFGTGTSRNLIGKAAGNTLHYGVGLPMQTAGSMLYNGAAIPAQAAWNGANNMAQAAINLTPWGTSTSAQTPIATSSLASNPAKKAITSKNIATQTDVQHIFGKEEDNIIQAESPLLNAMLKAVGNASSSLVTSLSPSSPKVITPPLFHRPPTVKKHPISSINPPSGPNHF